MAHAQTNPTYAKPVQVSKSTKLAFIEAGTGGRQLSLHSRSTVFSIPVTGLSDSNSAKAARASKKNLSKTSDAIDAPDASLFPATVFSDDDR